MEVLYKNKKTKKEGKLKPSEQIFQSWVSCGYQRAKKIFSCRLRLCGSPAPVAKRKKKLIEIEDKEKYLMKCVNHVIPCSSTWRGYRVGFLHSITRFRRITQPYFVFTEFLISEENEKDRAMGSRG